MGERKGPCIYLSGLPRTTTKAEWKWFYRLSRVTARESEKVQLDMMLFGTGFMMLRNGEDPCHVPAEKVMIQL